MSLNEWEALKNLFFFFQAEDGIRDKLVTGVQTCALPISSANRFSTPAKRWSISTSCLLTSSLTQLLVAQPVVRSTAAGRRIAHVQCCRIATSSASGRITMQRLRQLDATASPTRSGADCRGKP